MEIVEQLFADRSRGLCLLFSPFISLVRLILISPVHLCTNLAPENTRYPPSHPFFSHRLPYFAVCLPTSVFPPLGA